MIKSQQFPYVLGVAALAMMFSAVTVHPQAVPEPGEAGAQMNGMMIAQAAGGAQSSGAASGTAPTAPSATCQQIGTTPRSTTRAATSH